jgi:hypothetical protein
MSDSELPSTPRTRTALKEWAVACEALGRGDQILLLRKGGIREQQRHFRIEHPEFLLFPTFEHQRADLVKPGSRADLDRLLAERGPSDQIELRYWAQVAEVFEISETDQLQALAPLHLWSEDYALERLRWKPRHPLQVMALRVYRLAEATRLPLVAEYGGCTSWVTLAESVSLDGASPVLDETAFAAQLLRVREALGRSPVEVAR